MSDKAEDKIIQLVQGKWYPDYETQESKRHYFSVVYAHYSDSLKELALVLKVEDEDDKESGEIFYVLEKFQIGTKKYFDLIENAYAANFNENRIVAVCVEDFYNFSGFAMFDWVEGYKQINLKTYEAIECPCSPLWHLYDEN